MASAAIVAAAGLGAVVVFMSVDSPSTSLTAARADQAAAVTPDGLKTSVDPDLVPAAGPDVEVAQTQAETKQAKQTQYGLWVFSCAAAPAGESEKCAARLAVRDNKRNVTVIDWLIGHNKDGELLMEITTPVDVLIAPGLKMSIGEGAAQSFPYLSCALSGCLTRFRPDARLLDALRKAESVKLTIETPAGKALTFSIKVNGIGDSLDALARVRAG